MAGFLFPFSGDVTQAINPWELWIRSMSSQMGFINIRNVKAGDPEIEREVVETVASYGRQLGRINDVLDVLVDHLEPDSLSGNDRAAIADFRDMIEDIDRVKNRANSPESLLGALDDVLDRIRDLEAEDPETYDRAARRVRKKLPKR